MAFIRVKHCNHEETYTAFGADTLHENEWEDDSRVDDNSWTQRYEYEASIINMGSVSGIVPERGTISYGSSKASLMFATKVMANELSRYSIRVNAIAPNIIKTDMLADMDDKARKLFVNQSYLKREGDLNDISSLVLYLASNESKYVNGQIIRLDGGMKY